MLLDTTFLIDLMRGDRDAVEKAAEIESDLRQQRLSSMTLFELYYGASRSNQPEAKRKSIEDILASKPVHPADTAVMRKAGRIAGALANDGNRVGDGDVIIGATATVVDEPVLTRNVDDFDRLEGVEVETY
ncbi:type II toxin-antitoxin system VapC family toxin [Natrinema caseinilyticum]|uniref:type II toxin-antitoxin system VapC family toxin n=1 Tax=Natrinema caseinilyticum TaxID=2961570 RepID=UPI0020C41427|nr:type II toxin-antitoxin system VapC family toxin [Natrinema caseinilyticum]